MTSSIKQREHHGLSAASRHRAEFLGLNYDEWIQVRAQTERVASELQRRIAGVRFDAGSEEAPTDAEVWIDLETTMGNAYEVWVGCRIEDGRARGWKVSLYPGAEYANIPEEKLIDSQDPEEIAREAIVFVASVVRKRGVSIPEVEDAAFREIVERWF